MLVLHLTGRITEAGQLEVDLPPDLPSGEVELTLQLPDYDLIDDDEPLVFTSKTGEEIIASGLIGAWANLGIRDGQEWVEEARRKEQEKRAW